MIKQFILGFLLCYTVLVTWYASMLHYGKVASIQQACVERVGVAPVDLIGQLEGKR